MKKYLCFLVALVVMLVLAVPSYAATNAKTASMGKGITQVDGIGDLSTGDTAEVDTDGNLLFQPGRKEIETATASALLIGNGVGLGPLPVKLSKVIVCNTVLGGSSSLTVGLRDGTTIAATRLVEVEVPVGQTVAVNLDGAEFTNGVYVDMTGTGLVSVIYDD